MCTFSFEFVIYILVFFLDLCEESWMCRAPTSSRCFPGVDRFFSSRYHASYCARSLFFFSSLHPPLVRLITLLCASEAQSFRSNRERMDTSTSSVGISPFTETHLSPALSSHTAARHGRGGRQNKPEHEKKKLADSF